MRRRARTPRARGRAPTGSLSNRDSVRWVRSDVARSATRRDDRAEVLGIERAGLSFGHRGRRVRRDADPGFAVARVEDVRAVSRGCHPGVDDRLRARQPQRAPGDVLADRVADSRVVDVARRAHPVQRRFAVWRDVREVVPAGHVFAVPLRGARELRVGHERALAVRFAFLVDQAEHRRADQTEVVCARGQAGVRAGAGGTGAHRGGLS
jgi:hypothetical protein